MGCEIRVFGYESKELAGAGVLRRVGQAVLAPLLARQSSRTLLGAPRVGSFPSLSSSPACTQDRIPALPVRAVQEALAAFDLLANALQHASLRKEDQTIAVLCPFGWPSSTQIEDDQCTVTTVYSVPESPANGISTLP